MSEIRLVAERRTAFGKGAARKLRRARKIPAVLYGHGTDPVHIALPGHDTMLALKNANALLSIDVEGDIQLALARDVQRDPIRPIIEHIDLVIVRRGEKVTVDVPVRLEGEAESGTVVTTDYTTVQLLVEATDIPTAVAISIEGLPAGSQLHASDLVLPKGAELITDADALLVNVTIPSAEPAEDEGETEGVELSDSGSGAADEAAESGD
ncbi:MAG: 50S ribosomal protein L25/general stress protein Ctc [Actinomycetales bacterium]|nr:MAG: 50S ribosomal protein L25/general stress protein Ctc [Actinomycetales bacterium]